MGKARMSYVDNSFYVILGENGWWMCNPESPYDRRYGNGNIDTLCGNPLNAVRFDHRYEAERYIEQNWEDVGESKRPTVELVEVSVSVKRIKPLSPPTSTPSGKRRRKRANRT